MGSYVASPYDGSKYPASYPIGTVGSSTNIIATKWAEIYNAVNSERSRRGYGAISNPGLTGGTTITANKLNVLVTGINDTGYTSGFGGVSVGANVYAVNINDMIAKVQAAGSICLCNCNYCTCNCDYCTCNCDYCTCNCNYCTCDCNYCTCNCNYSDKRLKTNIEKIGVQNGFNIYTYNYIWDKTTKHTGVMAQEVLKTSYKHAIKIDKNGYYMVNYSALPITIKGL